MIKKPLEKTNNNKILNKKFVKKEDKKSSEVSSKNLNLKKRILNFLTENDLSRSVKFFVKKVFLPIFFKIILAAIAFIIIIYLFFSLFFSEKKDQFINKIEAKTKYFINLDFYQIKKIEIIGNIRSDRAEIEKIVKSTIDNFEKIEDKNLKESGNYHGLIEVINNEILTNFSWVKNAVVSRVIPDKIIIKIEEYIPFAVWIDGDNNFIIDSEGNKVEVIDISEFSNLLILSGDNAYKNVKSLSNILALNQEVSNLVYSATWLGNRRWDIRLKNSTLIKLPEKNIDKAWNNLINIYQLPGSLNDIESIDLRVEDKIFIIDSNSLKKNEEEINL
jgi:hypothetical protein